MVMRISRAAGIGALALALAGTFSTRGAAQDAAAPSQTIVDGVFTAAQATEGRAVFQKACMSCHSLPELASPKFALRWEGTTVGDVYNLILTTMPDGAPRSLDPKEYAAIVAFFLKESGYQEGEKELPTDIAVLKAIRIVPLPQ